jgi:hypothetical protein
VKEIIAAGNRIHDRPYGPADHAVERSPIHREYDCSSSTAFALLGAGLVTGGVNYVSGTFMGMYEPGRGRWVTIYAHGGHVWMIVAGIRWDTSHYGATAPAGSGPRWSENLARPTGGFVVRHPRGL